MKFHFASGNAHKAAELQLLADQAALPVEIVTAKSLGGMPPVAEDTGTFYGNAMKKARALQAKAPADAWVLADDSGVCVDALDGGPGVDSAYYAGAHGDSRANLAKLVEVMRDVPADRRGAHFLCGLAVLGPAGVECFFIGRCHGRLLYEPRGGSGFGYDPLFVPNGYEHTFAELGENEKNRISHRAKAWAELAKWVRGSAGKG